MPIFKTIDGPAPARRATAICNYIRGEGRAPLDVHNCLSPGTAHTEMARTGAQGRLPRQALRHLVLSWPPGETPAEVEAFGAAKKLLNRLGYSDNMALLGIHDDTAPGSDGAPLPRRHVHVALCVVHPETLRAHTPDHIRLAGDRICRELEIEYGWRVQNGPHVVRTGPDGRPRIERVRRDWSQVEASPPSQKAVSIGLRTGEPHLQQRAAGIGAILKADLPAMQGWQDWHRALAAHGLVYEPRGGGAVVREARERGQVAKASNFSRALSHAALTQRFGPYQPPSPAAVRAAEARRDAEHRATQEARAAEAMAVVRERRAEAEGTSSGGRPAGSSPPKGRAGLGAGRRRPRDQERRAAQREERALNRSALYAQWVVWKDDRRGARAGAWKAARAELRDRHAAAFREMVLRNRVERTQALRGDWRGRGPALNALRSVIAAQHAGRLAALRDAQAAERLALTKRLRASETARNDDWRSFLEATAKGDGPAARAARAHLKRERYRGGRAAAEAVSEDRPGFRHPEGHDQAPQDGPRQPRPRDIRDVTWEIDRVSGWVRYRSQDGAHTFTDTGDRVFLNRTADEDVRAAIQLAAVKFGGRIQLFGDADFKARAARLAREMGVEVSNPELRGLIGRIDANLAATRATAQREERRRASGFPGQPRPTAPPRIPSPPRDADPSRPETRVARQRARQRFGAAAAVDGTGRLRAMGIRFEVEAHYGAALRVDEDTGAVLMRHLDEAGDYAGHEVIGADGRSGYVEGCPRGLGVLGPAGTADRIVVVGSALDALSRAQMDGGAAAARTVYASTHGAPTPAQIRQLAAMAARRAGAGRYPVVEVALDDTVAGRAAAEAIRAGLVAAGVPEGLIVRTAPHELGWNTDLRAGQAGPGPHRAEPGHP